MFDTARSILIISRLTTAFLIGGFIVGCAAPLEKYTYIPGREPGVSRLRSGMTRQSALKTLRDCFTSGAAAATNPDWEWKAAVTDTRIESEQIPSAKAKARRAAMFLVSPIVMGMSTQTKFTANYADIIKVQVAPGGSLSSVVVYDSVRVKARPLFFILPKDRERVLASFEVLCPNLHSKH